MFTYIICQQSSSTLLLIDMLLCTPPPTPHPPTGCAKSQVPHFCAVSLSLKVEEVWHLSSVLPSSASTSLLDNFTTCDLPRKAAGSTRTHSQWCNAQCMSATLVSLNCTLLMLPTMLCSLKPWWETVLTDFSPSTDSSNCYSQCSSQPHDEWCNGSSLPTTTRNAPAIFWQIGYDW